ncbi:hypothetical protein VTL71DRAFT_7146 [Oculimacula yallundae]|uniref:Uncharacterized protein n=1 Tax=Oculimacula yallundae TaxID=86028 RepID=A0ABR4BVV4_9HELO
MPPKTSLRGFLRKDILQNRITTAPLKGRTHAPPKAVPEKSHELDYLFDEDITAVKDSKPESETDSLFEEPPVMEKTKTQERQENLRRFLAESNQARAADQKDTSEETIFMKDLKKELEELVTREGEADREEKLKLRVEKSALIRKIAALEAEEKGNKARQLKSNLDEFSKTLPACTPEEEKALKAKAEQISKAFAGLERVPSKRNRENTDNDLDGEERLRIGKSYKRRAMEVTGHWGATIHD